MTRTKTYYTSAELPHLWAHSQLPKGIRCRCPANVFVSDETIYSYGYHFPMAKRCRRKDGTVFFLVHPGRYSNSTNRHQSAVRRAMPADHPQFWILPKYWDDLLAKRWRPIAEYYNAKISRSIEDAAKPRIRQATRDAHLRAAHEWRKQWEKLHRFFGFRCSIDRVTVASVADLPAILAREKERKLAAERKAKAEQAKLMAALREYMPEWRRTGLLPPYFKVDTGRLATVRDLGYPVMRIVSQDTVNGFGPSDDRVSTSYGASVELSTVTALYARLHRIPDGYHADIGVGGYRGLGINSAGVRIGCHSFPWHEIIEFADWAKIPFDDSLRERLSTSATANNESERAA